MAKHETTFEFADAPSLGTKGLVLSVKMDKEIILRGWKEISAHTKLSITSIKELTRREINPLPMAFVANKPLTTSKSYSEWIEKELKMKTHQ